MHLEVFHQVEVLWLDDRQQLDAWQMTSRVLRSVAQLFPGRTIKILPTQYQMCSQSWEIEIEDDGRWFEVLAWGVFSERIVRNLGGDPERQLAVGVGYGLERLAMPRYGIDDIRRIEVASVAWQPVVKLLSARLRKTGGLQTAHGSANESHDRPDDGRHANFERRPFEIIHIDE